jgi:phenol 2-monooxygenase (NADPH)
VLEGRSPESLLSTYSAERQVIAKNLIEFDREWSSLMAARPDELADPTELEDFYVRTAEFPAGFMTQYPPSMLIGEASDQTLASGFPIGKRFKSAIVTRVCDANPVHIGHHAKADGRWRIYVFADGAAAGPSAASDLAEWISGSPESPVVAYTPKDADFGAWFDVKVIYQQDHTGVDLGQVPDAFKPRVGPFELIDYEKVYAADLREDIFDLRGIDRAGAIVVVRPDQYVANVLPLHSRDELAGFFEPIMLPHRARSLTPREVSPARP